jgi:hypothetical protein
MTDEERERIYEEEKAHADARSRLEQEQKAAAAAKKPKTKGCVIGCLVVLILLFILSMLSGPAKHTDERGLDTRDPDYKALSKFADGK